MGAAAGWDGAAGIEPAAAGVGVGGARRVWLEERAAGGEGAGEGRRKQSLMSL